MEIQVRRIEPSEQRAAIETCEQAFGWDVPTEDMDAIQKLFNVERTFVAVEGETIVGAGGNYDFEMSIPGGSVPVAGLTMVGVLPTHRRKGVLRRLMVSFLDDPRGRGESMSALWASESSIYQRFGYGMASMHMQIEAERARMVFLDDPGPVGRGRFVGAEDALKVLPDIYNRVMQTTPGMMGRSDAWWEHHRLRDPERLRGGASHMWRVVHELDGRPEAYALYRVHSDWPDGNPRGKVQVIEAMATSAIATRELWRFLFGIDLIDTIKSDFMPVDHPLQLMLADPRRMTKRLGDNLWLRMIDVKKALEQRSYAAPDALILEIADDLFPNNSGTWRLDTGGDSAAVTRSDADPDIRLHVRDLAALYLGGHTGAALALAGRLQGQPPDIARLDALFHTPQAPWCPEIF